MLMSDLNERAGKLAWKMQDRWKRTSQWASLTSGNRPIVGRSVSPLLGPQSSARSAQVRPRHTTFLPPFTPLTSLQLHTLATFGALCCVVRPYCCLAAAPCRQTLAARASHRYAAPTSTAPAPIRRAHRRPRYHALRRHRHQYQQPQHLSTLTRQQQQQRSTPAPPPPRHLASHFNGTAGHRCASPHTRTASFIVRRSAFHHSLPNCLVRPCPHAVRCSQATPLRITLLPQPQHPHSLRQPLRHRSSTAPAPARQRQRQHFQQQPQQ
jgi:hypothetical protein